MMARLKIHLANTALVVVSVLLTYLVVEFAFFRVLLPNLSASVMARLVRPRP
jgi:hypothetical protein